MTLAAARVAAAIGIMALAALVTAVLVVWLTLQGQPLPGYVITVGGFLLGFATHELGVARGAASAAISVPLDAPVSN